MQGWGVFFTILPHLGARGAHSPARPWGLAQAAPCKTLRAPPSNSRVLFMAFGHFVPSGKTLGFAQTHQRLRLWALPKGHVSPAGSVGSHMSATGARSPP